MTAETVKEKSNAIADKAAELAGEASELAATAGELATREAAAQGGEAAGLHPAVLGLTVLVLAIFVGYYVVWKVTPALHSPLLSVTNAVSSVIVVGALIAAGPVAWSFSKGLGLIAVFIASINIFGGFLITQRMLGMFKKKT